jgi:hypothetical protein
MRRTLNCPVGATRPVAEHVAAEGRGCFTAGRAGGLL